MTKLTLELPSEVYRRLHAEADRQGKPLQAVAQQWLLERLSATPPASDSNREKVRQALRNAGLLVERKAPPQVRVDPAVHLEDVEASFARAGGKPLSEIILEQRDPKG